MFKLKSKVWVIQLQFCEWRLIDLIVLLTGKLAEQVWESITEVFSQKYLLLHPLGERPAGNKQTTVEFQETTFEDWGMVIFGWETPTSSGLQRGSHKWMGKEPQANKGEYIRQRNAINWNLLLWRFMRVAINPRLNSEYFALLDFFWDLFWNSFSNLLNSGWNPNSISLLSMR